LFRNLANGRFERMGAAPGSGLAGAWPSRGLALGDLDGDGRPDAVFNNLDSAPTLLRNVTKSGGHWLSLRLIGDVTKKSPKDATGAIAYLTIGKVRRRADVFSGASFGSQNDSRLHFGLGASTRVDKLEVKWPDGELETFEVPGPDRVLMLVEGKGSSKGK
jgi:enediyne biosynthesis protein E4